MINPNLFIIILNWNGLHDTIECIESLKRSDYKNFQILVVDNGSDADYYRLIEIKEIELLRLQENIGFAGGANAGIKYALDNNADYILLLNNDTIVSLNFLSLLIKNLTLEENCGIVAPQINYYNAPKKIWSAGGNISKIRGSGFVLSNKIKNKEGTNRFVDFVSGCCMLIRKEVFNKVNDFDENYFLYVEDVDFCKRVIDSGFKIMVVPQSKIWHKVNASTLNNNSYIPLYYNTRNRLYFTKKFFPKFIRITYAYIYLSMTLKFFIWKIRGEKKKIQVVRRAFRDFNNGKMGKRSI